ncbi:hypothetical protein [Brevundimonas mediterranea]|uniref:Uncharacterized protein n=1 Tax=Brevundimonas mediterranea TaxID=74329 RepID=A0A7W6EZT9_9CAUL|nr:hypothetical protein [Brevundimonas mediterranea]MBB3872290.1 hypothetical protein [Brevundimonas mediterranea]
MNALRYVRAPWPEPEAHQGEPIWLLYEIDDVADAVTRTVDLFADGTATRNSIEIEERNGQPCPSLIDTSLADGFEGVDLEVVSGEDFASAWAKGTDKPFWNVR